MGNALLEKEKKFNLMRDVLESDAPTPKPRTFKTPAPTTKTRTYTTPGLIQVLCDASVFCGFENTLVLPENNIQNHIEIQ